MISKAQNKDCSQLAILHLQTINQGFLPKLGVSFLQYLYKFLIQKELVLVYKEGDEVLGFVSCAISSKGIMKRFFFTSRGGVFQLATALLKKPSLLKPLLETYRAPQLSESSTEPENKIPETELLSISVSPAVQKGGIGTQLLHALEIELKKMGIVNFKVVAGEALAGANRFYLKNGFVPAKQITIHGNEVSNVYVKEM